VEDVRGRVHKTLEAFLDAQAPRLEAVADEVAPVTGEVRAFVLDGGKRLRPAFCYWGWRGAGGPDVDEIVTAAASLELLHACALIHDDVMDASDTRRGRAAVHRRFATLHDDTGWCGSSTQFGLGAAILLGDLCLIWADQLLGACGLPAPTVQRGRALYDEMRVELMAGQYLDLVEQARGDSSVDRALRVARYKSAKYTVERPLHLGAVLADAAPDVLAAYSRFGLPLGEAFQLRDDVLGVYGDPSHTGKPAGDDLREGKRTVLVAAALDGASAAQRDVVQRLLGDPSLDADGVERLRDVIDATGARAEAEGLIDRLTDAALAALAGAPLDPTARHVLAALARTATSRSA
jgi:geranylgeranyl diphosphate synthase type I